MVVLQVGSLRVTKKIFQGKGRKGTSILGLHLSNIRGLEHSLHGEGGKLCCLSTYSLIIRQLCISSETAHFFAFISWHEHQELSDCENGWVSHIFLLLETFLIEVCKVALCDTSWLAIRLHLRAQNHPTAQRTGGTQMLNECLGLTALFSLMA